MRIGQVGLHNDFGVGQIADIHAGNILRSTFVRDPEDAPTIGELLKRDSFATVAEAVQIVMGDQFHVFDFLTLCCHRASSNTQR